MDFPNRARTVAGGWRAEQVAELLSRSSDQLLFFAGCSEEQAELPFDYRVLLTAPEPVVIDRLRTRTNNPYGTGEQQLSQVLTDFAEIEPLIRRSADLVLTTTEPPASVADTLLRRIAALGPAR